MREDWVECTIDNIVSNNGVFVDGDWVEKKDQDINGTIRLIQLSDIGDGYFRNRSNIFINEETSEKLRVTFLYKDDILIARMPEPLGRATIFPFDGKFITAVDVAILRLGHKMIENKYVLYLINSPLIRNEISKLESGTTRKRISRKNLSTIKFPIAPLPEQRAIVKKIETLFSSLDAGIADLKKAQEQLKIYRQAVLKKAFEGELTKEWRGDGSNPLKEDNLGNIFTVSSGKNLTKNKMRSGAIPVYGGNGIMGYHNEYNNDEVKLIIGRVGVKCGVTHLTEKYSWITDNALIVNFHSPQDYDLKFMQLKLQYENLNKLSNSTAQPVISGSQIYAYKVVLPQKEEQAQIVKEIESRLSVCDAVEQQIKDSLSQAEALRQSILKKAFQGRLLSESEVEACKQEHDYEPAAELLEKIKAEKEANKPVKNQRKK